MKWFYATGTNGSILECEDGRSADTVGGDSAEFERLMDEADADPSQEWQKDPLLTDMTEQQVMDYVGE